MAIGTNTAAVDIYKEFYSLISDNISSGVEVATINADDPSTFPAVIIGTPQLPRTKETFDRYNRSGELMIEIASKTTQKTLELCDEVDSIIFNNLSSLSVQRVQSGQGEPVTIEKGGVQLKVMTLPIEFMYRQ